MEAWQPGWVDRCAHLKIDWFYPEAKAVQFVLKPQKVPANSQPWKEVLNQ